MSGRDKLFGSFSPSSAADQRFNMLMSEHISIQNSEAALDATLEVGAVASDRLFAQSSAIGRSNANLQMLIGTLPGSRFLATRKSDRLILGSLIGSMMVFRVVFVRVRSPISEDTWPMSDRKLPIHYCESNDSGRFL
jgi:hypothetical protein